MSTSTAVKKSSIVSLNPEFAGDQQPMEPATTKSNSKTKILLGLAFGVVAAAAFAVGYVASPSAAAPADVVTSGATADPETALYAIVQNDIQLASNPVINNFSKLTAALDEYLASGTVPAGVSEEFMKNLAAMAPPKPDARRRLRQQEYHELISEVTRDLQTDTQARDFINTGYSIIINGVENMQNVITFDTDILGVELRGNECWVIAKETDESADWSNNLSTGIIDIKNVDQTSSGSYGSSAKGFRGFVEAYNNLRLNMWSTVKSECIAKGATKFNFAGYSRGGAISAIAASALYLEGKLDGQDISVFTYGCPRAMSKADSDKVHNKFFQQWRLSYRNDPIVSLPYGWMGAKHFGFHVCKSCNYSAGRDKPGFAWPGGDHTAYQNMLPLNSFSSSETHQNI